MNQKGFIIPLSAWAIMAIVGSVAGLWAANTAGLFGLAEQGEACGLPTPRPCADGTVCNEGICTPTVGGGVDQFFYALSLNKLLCRGNVLASASCEIILNLSGAIILGALAVLLTVIWLNSIPPTIFLGVIFFVGAILGLFFSGIINYFWWVLIIVIIFLGYIAVKTGVIGNG